MPFLLSIQSVAIFLLANVFKILEEQLPFQGLHLFWSIIVLKIVRISFSKDPKFVDGSISFIFT